MQQTMGRKGMLHLAVHQLQDLLGVRGGHRCWCYGCRHDKDGLPQFFLCEVECAVGTGPGGGDQGRIMRDSAYGRRFLGA